MAISICGLMLFFAVGSKVAAYHPKELAARSIAATKVWQAKNVASDSEVADTGIALRTALELVLLLSLCLVVAVPQPERERPHRDLLADGYAPLAKRPPPAF
jgi:hypothetical protein